MTPKSISMNNLKFMRKHFADAVSAIVLKGEQLMDFLEHEGVPMDDFFYENVIFCSLYKEDPECLVSPSELERQLSPVVDQCGKIDTAKVNGTSVATGKVETMDSLQTSEEITRYCTECYWPFMTVLMNSTLSDQFWCANRYILEAVEQDSNHTKSAAMIMDLLLTDTSFISCMDNARGLFFSMGVDPFNAQLTRNIRLECWKPKNFPQDPVISKDNAARIKTLSC